MTTIYKDSGITVYAITFIGEDECGYEASNVEILFDTYEHANQFFATLECPEHWQIDSMKVFTYPLEKE